MNRREWLGGLGLATLAACSRRKGTGFYGYALVANAGDNSMAAVDLTAFRMTTTIGLGAAPSRILAAPGDGAAFVLTPLNGTVHVIDSQFKRVGSQRLADFVSEIGLSGDGKSLLALAPHARQLIQVDAAALAPMARHKLSIEAQTADFSSSGLAAVANSSGAIELVDLKTGKRSRAQTGELGSIRFRADGKMLLAANLQNRSLLALEVPSLQVVVELPLAMRPDNLCFNSDQGQLFVSGVGMDGVAVVFPYKTIEVDQTLLAGHAPGTMTCSETPAYLFVGSNSGSGVCILNIDTRKVVGFVEMGGQPSLIRVTPDSQYALVFDELSGAMGVIHVAAIRESGDARRLRNGVSLFTMLSVGSKPVDALVVRRVG